MGYLKFDLMPSSPLHPLFLWNYRNTLKAEIREDFFGSSQGFQVSHLFLPGGADEVFSG